MALDPTLQADVTNQADLQRKRAAQQEGANLQGQKDAIARRAASLGGGPSGAFVKQEQLAGDRSADRLQSANEGINAQADSQLGELRKVQQGQDFAHGERLGSQQFASGERAAGQTFAHGERVGSQQFASGERQAGQAFTHGENQSQIQAAKDSQDAAIKAAAEQGKLTRDQADKALAQNQSQYDTDLAESKKANLVSTILSGLNSKVSPDVMNAMLAQLGYPDLGSIPGLTADMFNPQEQAAANATEQGRTDKVNDTQKHMATPGGIVSGMKKSATVKSLLHT